MLTIQDNLYFCVVHAYFRPKNIAGSAATIEFLALQYPRTTLKIHNHLTEGNPMDNCQHALNIGRVMSKKALQAFGFPANLVSIYKYSPVYKYEGKILKRTKRKQHHYDGMVRWLQHINSREILSVQPLAADKIIDDERWILYPFIQGEKYQPTRENIYASGRLLGSIHKISIENRYLQNSHKWSNLSEIQADLDIDLEMIMERYSGRVGAEILERLSQDISQFMMLEVESFAQLNLPFVDGVWDYKASNIVFTKHGPILIDPDNCGHIPRILDLALALLLFHQAMETAPPEIFTTKQWQAFLAGYESIVDLLPIEREAWQQILNYVYMDEVIWALTDHEEDKEELRQRLFIQSLLDIDLGSYTL